MRLMIFTRTCGRGGRRAGLRARQVGDKGPLSFRPSDKFQAKGALVKQLLKAQPQDLLPKCLLNHTTATGLQLPPSPTCSGCSSGSGGGSRSSMGSSHTCAAVREAKQRLLCACLLGAACCHALQTTNQQQLFAACTTSHFERTEPGGRRRHGRAPAAAHRVLAPCNGHIRLDFLVSQLNRDVGVGGPLSQVCCGPNRKHESPERPALHACLVAPAESRVV